MNSEDLFRENIQIICEEALAVWRMKGVLSIQQSKDCELVQKTLNQMAQASPLIQWALCIFRLPIDYRNISQQRCLIQKQTSIRRRFMTALAAPVLNYIYCVLIMAATDLEVAHA